jgi:hypothetical protein
LPFFEEQVKQEFSDNSNLIYEDNYIRWQIFFIFVIIVLWFFLYCLLEELESKNRFWKFSYLLQET